MVLRQVRIGNLVDIHQYDDDVYTEAIDTDGQPIEIGQATSGTQAVRQDQLPSLGDVVSAANPITDNRAVRGDGGGKGIQDSDVTIKDGGDVSIPTGKGYQVNDIQVITDRQAAEADIVIVPDLTGADTIDQASLESYLGDIRTTINSLLSKLRTHGLIDT
jgi:hypothetical protein